MKKRWTALTAAVFCWAGCEKIIDPKNLPEQEPRLVVNGVLAAGEPVWLNLSSSRSIVSGKNYAMIEGGRCDLYENGKLLGALNSDGNGYYHFDHEPVTGRTYKIVASASGFETTSGETVMPGRVSIASARLTDTVNHYLTTYSGGDYVNLSGDVRFVLEFDDDKSRTNYYKLEVFGSVTDSTGQEQSFPVNGSITHLNSLSESDSYFGSSMVFTDGTQFGDRVKLDVLLSFYGSLDGAPKGYKVAVDVRLSQISEAYYLYSKTANDQTMNNGNPFSEPVQVYSNMSNGMGILAALHADSLRRIFHAAPRSF